MTPDSFRNALQHFDKRLDFVWNGRKSRYEIVGIDARHKKYLIASFGLGKIDTLGLQYIRDMAMMTPKEKSAKEINRLIDEEIERQEKAETRHLDNAIEERIDEAWEHFGYKEGFRVSFANVSDDTGHPVKITDRRRFINELSTTEPASRVIPAGTGVKLTGDEK